MLKFLAKATLAAVAAVALFGGAAQAYSYLPPGQYDGKKPGQYDGKGQSQQQGNVSPYQWKGGTPSQQGGTPYQWDKKGSGMQSQGQSQQQYLKPVTPQYKKY